MDKIPLLKLTNTLSFTQYFGVVIYFRLLAFPDNSINCLNIIFHNNFNAFSPLFLFSSTYKTLQFVIQSHVLVPTQTFSYCFYKVGQALHS